MLVEHASPHCGSRQFYNGILDEHAHGVFHGRIVVHKDAQKTDAKQTNRNLLLSDDAQIDTKPQLEIYADDVKCTHGATIGQIEENALFYLRSRGIDEDRRAAAAADGLRRRVPGPHEGRPGAHSRGDADPRAFAAAWRGPRAASARATAARMPDGVGGSRMSTVARRCRRMRACVARARRRAARSTWRRFARDFPILREQMHGKPLVYLDNAATSQKPQAVIDAIARYYEHDNANIHRGVHFLSERATEEYEAGARRRCSDF